MSEYTLTPLLDNYVVGAISSHHHGMRTYPAIHKDSGQRCMVKVHSFPAEESATEALLLTGAVPDKTAADDYYQTCAKLLCRQVAVINALSQWQDFGFYLGYQTEKKDPLGYEVAVIAPYRNTLRKLLDKQTITDEFLIHMGITLCTALARCRKAGYLYIALKPENVYITEDGRFQIGDIGFVALQSLPYAILPDSCQNIYTPAECHDCFGLLNETIDTYTLGVLLLECSIGNLSGAKEIDVEKCAATCLKPIIQKACAGNPRDRYQSPEEMAAALYSCKGSHEDLASS